MLHPLSGAIAQAEVLAGGSGLTHY